MEIIHSVSPFAQKLGVLLLSLLTVGVASLGILSVKSGIGKPFYRPKAATAQAPDEETRLKSQDTDRDGLSDWDELNLYGTSAYLEDTDSDGISDFDEVKRGTDPNCPEGKNCVAASPGGPVFTATSTGSRPPPIVVPSITGLLGSATLGEKPDPKALRKALLETGIDAHYLERIDDATLLSLYQEVIQEGVGAQGIPQDATNTSAQ